MRTLWSAANIKIYGGGVSEVEFLRELSQLIGEYRAPSQSVSHDKQGRSVTTGDSCNEFILDVADLSALVPTNAPAVQPAGPGRCGPQ